MNYLHSKPFLKVVHWNCYQLDKIKLNELKLFINEFKPDLISLQEVKLNQEQANLFLRFDFIISQENETLTVVVAWLFWLTIP